MRILPCIAGVVLAAHAAGPAAAAWPDDPAVNVAVCRAAYGQQFPVGAPAGAGAIVAWIDLRGGANFDIYAQRVLDSGAVDPAWPANGLAVCTAPSDQQYPAILADGSGGAFIVWCDGRPVTSFDLYAQHVLASGVLDPTWPAGGLAVCAAPGSQWFPVLASDGGSGFLVAWYDARGGGADVYAQHVLATGAVDPAWPAGGRAVCTATGDQDDVRIVPDGGGGAVLVWADRRDGVNSDLYAARVLATGALDPAWPAGGLAVCTAPGNQLAPRAIPDGAGGAIVAWQDTRGGSEYDVYAQHVLGSGAVDPAWPAGGLAACTAPANQVEPRLVPDGGAAGATGAIVAWTDNRTPGGSDVYAQHVLGSGAVDAAWPAGGRALCTAPDDQHAPDLSADGAGGAIAVWADTRGGAGHDLYAQHVFADGTLDPAWPADGRAVSTAAGDQQNPVIVSVPRGAGSLPIVAWDDDRDGNYDIYAQPATPPASGAIAPGLAGVSDRRPDEGGWVTVSWHASGLDVSPLFGITDYRVWRAAPGGGWQVIAALPATAQATYALAVPTLADSTGAGVPLHAFVIEARGDTTNPSQHWFSAPDSGYSVDDLAPAQPAGFGGTFAAGTTSLHWRASGEPDLAGYRLYRSFGAGFTPGPGNFVIETTDTSFTDPAGAAYAYKLSAVDVHGNESPHAVFLPGSTASAGGGPPVAVALALAGANPARGTVVLRFALASPGRVTLALFDPHGRRVRRLADGAFAAGAHVAAWDGRDDDGRQVPPGLYFARLEAGAGVATCRVVRTE